MIDMEAGTDILTIERPGKPVVGMATRFTFIGKVIQVVGRRTVCIRIEAYDHFSPLKPGVNEVKVWLSNLEASQSVDGLGGVELEVSIGSLPLHAGDTVSGVFRHINQVEKFIVEDSWQLASNLHRTKKHSEKSGRL